MLFFFIVSDLGFKCNIYTYRDLQVAKLQR